MAARAPSHGTRRIFMGRSTKKPTRVKFSYMGKEWKKNKPFESFHQDQSNLSFERTRRTGSANGTFTREEPGHGGDAQQASELPLLPLSASALQCVKLLENQKWYAVSEEVQKSSCERPEVHFSSIREASVELKRRAAALERHVSAYLSRLQLKSGRDQVWLSSMTTKGTLNDRIAASVLLIQQCPLAQTMNLHKLVQQAGKAGRREAYLAAEALKDLFSNDLLPSDRKLYFFEDHPLLAERFSKVEGTDGRLKPKRRKRAAVEGLSSHQDATVTLSARFSEAELLMLWLEDFLKSSYAQFVAILAAGSEDSLPFYQQKCLKFAYELLVACPEQEKGHLTLLISRLSSQNPKCAGTACYFLRQLLEVQKPMAPIVCQYVMQSISEQLASGALTAKSVGGLYRPVFFLSCVPCRKADGELARHMAEIYMRIFRALVERLEASLDRGLQIRKSQLRNRKLKRKRRLKLKNANETVGKETQIKDKEAGITDDAFVTFNSRLLKAILKGLTRAVTLVPNKLLDDLNVDTQLFTRVIRRIDNSAVKIVFFSFLYKMAGLLQLDVRHLDSIFYASLQSFQFLDASNRCAILSCIANEGGIRPPHLTFSLFRRLLQTASHVNRSALQIIFLHRLGIIFEKYPAWVAPLFALSEQQLAEDDACEEFRDVPLPELSKTTNVFGNSLCPDEDLQTKEGDGSNTKTLLPSGQYDPNGSRPDLARPDGSHLWELELQACSVVPNVAACARDLRNWSLSRKGSQLDTSVSLPSLSDYLPHVATPKDDYNVVSDTWDPLSTTAVLDLLAYRPPSKVLKKKKRQTKALEAEEEPLLAEGLNSPAYWKHKKHAFPHERFMERYFTDGFVVRRAKNRNVTTEGEDADSDFEAVDMDLGGEEREETEDWMKRSDLSASDVDEDDAMDTFLDDILAAEADDNGTEDDDCMGDDAILEDDFSGVENYEETDVSEELPCGKDDFAGAALGNTLICPALDDSTRARDSVEDAHENFKEFDVNVDGSNGNMAAKSLQLKRRGLKRKARGAGQGSFADAEAFRAYLT